MRKIQYILYVAFVVLFFTACQEDDFGGAEQGGIRIALADGTTGVNVTTRSTPSELFDGFKKKFKFQIKGGDNYDQTHEWTEDVIPLAAGVYEIIATCGTEQAAGVVEFDKPYYTGKAEGIKVEVGKEAKAEVKCKVTNALVSIKFAEGYETYAENAYAMIAVGSGIETNWAELSESAYFKAGSSLTKLVLYKNGSESLPTDILTEAKKVSGFPETFKAGDHLILTLSVAKKNGNVSFKVSKVELKEVTIEETIPMEWLPKPKVEAEGFDGNALTFVETETKAAKLNLTLASALQDMRLKFNFGDAQFTALNRDTGYLWSNSEDKAVIENTLGINVSDKSVDLNGLLAKLQTNAGATTTNTIEVDVKANDRWSSEDENANRTYTITCNKPQFSIAVQPGNVWTKTFTIDEPTVMTGNADVLKEKLVYQYKEKDANDNAWQNCSSGLEQVFSKAPSNKSYQVRAFYREGITSEVVDVTLETPAQVPNANMDVWTDSERYTQPYYLPWGNGIEQWWDTNNNATMPDDYWTYINYKCFPTTVYTNSGVSGKAAEIRSVAVNGANSEVAHWGDTRGILYAGTTDNNGNITEGRDWYSRPSKVTFMHKYDSYDNERFGVYVELLAEDGTSIAHGNMVSTHGENISTFTKGIVSLKYTNMQLKASKIKVRFVSVADGESVSTRKQTIIIPAGSHKIYGGSVLTIDDIQLIYDK